MNVKEQLEEMTLNLKNENKKYTDAVKQNEELAERIKTLSEAVKRISTEKEEELAKLSEKLEEVRSEAEENKIEYEQKNEECKQIRESMRKLGEELKASNERAFAESARLKSMMIRNDEISRECEQSKVKNVEYKNANDRLREAFTVRNSTFHFSCMSIFQSRRIKSALSIERLCQHFLACSAQAYLIKALLCNSIQSPRRAFFLCFGI